jgi:hypothetical protein
MKLRYALGSVLDYLLGRQLAFGWYVFRSGVSKQIRKRKRWQILLHSKVDSCIAFCFVHWNASDFLLLTVNQIELLYPKSKIYIFDNSSTQVHLASLKSELSKFNNVTLFTLLSPPKWAKKLHLDTLFGWQSHTAGLQFLLNYSAKQSDEIAVFLDQDCIISKPIDEAFFFFFLVVSALYVLTGYWNDTSWARHNIVQIRSSILTNLNWDIAKIFFKRELIKHSSFAF